MLEYEEILTQTYSANTAKIVLHQLAIAPNVHFAEPTFRWQLVENAADDNKFSDLAISINADFLGNDADFDIFKTLTFPSLTVIKLEVFLAIVARLND